MKLIRFALLAAVMTAFAVAPAWAGLGVHSVDATNPCKRCHDTAKGTATLRGWAGGSLPDTAGLSGSPWAARTISSLCYMCHTSGGGGYTATNQTTNAYATGSHGNVASRMPDGPDVSTDATMATSGLPYAVKTNIECTACHNVHKYEDKPFIQRATVATLCTACHKGRVNSSPLRGTANTFAGTGHNYSTHPTVVNVANGSLRASIKTLATPGANPGVNVPYATSGQYQLGGHIVGGATTNGSMDCGTCHAVHGTRQGTAGVDDLLAVDNTTGSLGNALCGQCHNGGQPGGAVGSVNTSDHPIDDSTGQAFYPSGTLNNPPGIWTIVATDRAPQPWFTTGVTGTPSCSSCHDTHGGMPLSGLLNGPEATGDWAFSYQTWCWVCHTFASIVPVGHHSNQLNLPTSQIVCGDCHGAAGSDNWTAHNGFWGFGGIPVSTTNSAICEACHTAVDPTFLITTGLKNVAGTLSNATSSYPAVHGTLRSDNASSHAGSSHQVNLAANETNTNLTKKITAWGTAGSTGSAGISEWGAGVNEPICESCHNIIVNGLGTATATISSGWQANLLLMPYEDDIPGVTGAGHAVGDMFCRGCHTSAATGINVGFVHNPAAHTVLAATSGGTSYALAEVPYGRPTLTLLTDETAACGTNANRTTADAATSPNTLSYPSEGNINCDSCHRPHNADADSLDTNRYLILETTNANAWGTTICAECHNTDIQCQ